MTFNHVNEHARRMESEYNWLKDYHRHYYCWNELCMIIFINTNPFYFHPFYYLFFFFDKSSSSFNTLAQPFAFIRGLCSSSSILFGSSSYAFPLWCVQTFHHKYIQHWNRKEYKESFQETSNSITWIFYLILFDEIVLLEI